MDSRKPTPKSKWITTILGELCGQRGQSVEPGKAPETAFELYSVPSFPTGRPEVVFGRQIGSNKQRVEPRSVLLCKINPRINRAWVVGDFTRHTKIASTEWIVFPPRSEVHPEFPSYFLQQNQVRDFLAFNVSGVGGSLMRVKPSTLRDFPFAYPPLPIQRRIVAEIEKQFTRLEAGVAALKRVQAGLKRYRAAVLKAACTGQLVPTEAELARKAKGKRREEDKRSDGSPSSVFPLPSSFESGAQLLTRILAERRAKWLARHSLGDGGTGRGSYKEPAAPDTANLPPLPEGWAWASVEQLAAPEPNSITDGPFGSNLKTEHYTDSGPRVIRLQNIGDGVFVDEYAHISEEHFGHLEKHRVFPNDLVIAALGENPPRSCLVPEGLGPAIVKADCIRFRPHRDVASKYANIALNSDPVRRRTKTIVHGVGRPRLNLGEIKSIVLLLPPLAEQQRIVAEVERRLSVVEELEAMVSANLQRAGRLRQAILRQAFAGRL